MTYEYDERLLFAEVELGIATKQFINSDVGKYIVGRATEELNKARDDLEKLPTCSDFAIKDAKIKARAMRCLINWLNEAINNGQQAEAVLTENE